MATAREKAFDQLLPLLKKIAEKGFKVDLWKAATPEEKAAQGGFITRLAEAAAVKLLDWEVVIGKDKKTDLRTMIRFTPQDFAEVKASLTDLHKKVDAIAAAQKAGTP